MIMCANERQVIEFWSNGKNARDMDDTVRSIDGFLYSFKFIIGRRSKSGTCIVRGGAYPKVPSGVVRDCELAAHYADAILPDDLCDVTPLFNDEVPF